MPADINVKKLFVFTKVESFMSRTDSTRDDEKNEKGFHFLKCCSEFYLNQLLMDFFLTVFPEK
jgi:hypothetical protein